MLGNVKTKLQTDFFNTMLLSIYFYMLKFWNQFNELKNTQKHF
jgi:hypothetical protein